MVKSVEISTKLIGEGQPCFVIAEAGVNHNGDLDMAKRLVDVALECRADAVKFQTFNADRIVTVDAPKAYYQELTTDVSESQYEMIRRLELNQEMHWKLKTYCDDLGILFMSSPFDEESSDLLAELNVAVFKIPSGEITNLPYLAHIARHGKPMLMSTGMSNLGEVEEAVNVIEANGNPEYALFHCVSNYPAEPSDVNLNAMHTMKSAFGVPIGYSDHTRGISVAIAAVALGAKMIEKHLTLDNKLPGPDHKASLEPREFASMVENIRIIESALGNGKKVPAPNEENTASVARKSLVAREFIRSGTVITDDMIIVKRPGTGISPSLKYNVIGRTSQIDISVDALIKWEMLI